MILGPPNTCVRAFGNRNFLNLKINDFCGRQTLSKSLKISDFDATNRSQQNFQFCTSNPSDLKDSHVSYLSSLKNKNLVNFLKNFELFNKNY